MPDFGEHFKPDSTTFVQHHMGAVGDISTIIKTSDPSSLRAWWHTVLRNHGKYPCYAVFLVLPSDKEVADLLMIGTHELHIISGNDCLIIVLGGTYFITVNDGLSSCLVEATEKHITEGESLKFAEIFDIPLTEFPCLIFFEDIRSKEYALVSFKALNTQEITQELREVFTHIRSEIHANAHDKRYSYNKPDVLQALRRYRLERKLRTAGREAKKIIFTLADKTVESVVDAWVKAVLK